MIVITMLFFVFQEHQPAPMVRSTVQMQVISPNTFLHHGLMMEYVVSSW